MDLQCTKCLTELDDSVTFCHVCQSPVDDVEVEVADVPVVVNQGKNDPVPHEEVHIPFWTPRLRQLVIAAALLAVIVTVVVIIRSAHHTYHPPKPDKVQRLGALPPTARLGG